MQVKQHACGVLRRLPTALARRGPGLLTSSTLSSTEALLHPLNAKAGTRICRLENSKLHLSTETWQCRWGGLELRPGSGRPIPKWFGTMSRMLLAPVRAACWALFLNMAGNQNSWYATPGCFT